MAKRCKTETTLIINYDLYICMMFADSRPDSGPHCRTYCGPDNTVSPINLFLGSKYNRIFYPSGIEMLIAVGYLITYLQSEAISSDSLVKIVETLVSSDAIDI
jgi:hypothetical protein